MGQETIDKIFSREILYIRPAARTGASESGEKREAGQPSGVSGSAGARSSSFFLSLARIFGILIESDVLRLRAASLSSACRDDSAKDGTANCRGLGRASLPAFERNLPMKDSVDLDERSMGALGGGVKPAARPRSSFAGARSGNGAGLESCDCPATCSVTGAWGGTRVG